MLKLTSMGGMSYLDGRYVAGCETSIQQALKRFTDVASVSEASPHAVLGESNLRRTYPLHRKPSNHPPAAAAVLLLMLLMLLLLHLSQK